MQHGPWQSLWFVCSAESTGGYIYDIFIGKDRYMRQYIPAVSDYMAFSTLAEAYKTASFTAGKIWQHILPATGSVTELDIMGVP